MRHCTDGLVNNWTCRVDVQAAEACARALALQAQLDAALAELALLRWESTSKTTEQRRVHHQLI